MLISLFSFHHNAPHARTERAWALPHNLTGDHFGRYATVDLRIGGFGLFFSWALVLSTIAYALAVFRKNKNDAGKYHLFLGILFVSLFILPYAWWARYFPYFYAFPLIMLLYSEREKQNRSVVWLRKSVYLLLLLNTLLWGSAAIVETLKHRTIVNQAIDVFAKSKEPVQITFDCNFALKLKLDDRNVPYQETYEKRGPEIGIGPAIYLDPEKYIQEDRRIIEVQP